MRVPRRWNQANNINLVGPSLRAVDDRCGADPADWPRTFAPDSVHRRAISLTVGRRTWLRQVGTASTHASRANPSSSRDQQGRMTTGLNTTDNAEPQHQQSYRPTLMWQLVETAVQT